jgi:putative transposase
VIGLCELAGMTPQNYYARRIARQRQEVDLALTLELVRVQRKQQSRLGVRKLYYLIRPELKAAGVKLGRDRLFAELGKAGLLVERKPQNGREPRILTPILRYLRT